jgi:hypothetical protein
MCDRQEWDRQEWGSTKRVCKIWKRSIQYLGLLGGLGGLGELQLGRLGALLLARSEGTDDVDEGKEVDRTRVKM